MDAARSTMGDGLSVCLLGGRSVRLSARVGASWAYVGFRGTVAARPLSGLLITIHSSLDVCFWFAGSRSSFAIALAIAELGVLCRRRGRDVHNISTADRRVYALH